MPGPKTIVTSKGTFFGLRSFAEFLGVKPENIKAMVRAGRAEELIAGTHRGYDPTRLGIEDPRLARSVIGRRLSSYARAGAKVETHLGARLLTTEAEHVYASPENAQHLLIDCGVEEHPVWRAHLEVLARGGWCGHCSNAVLKTIEEVRRAIEERGWVWVGGTYANANSPLQLRCQDGHPFSMTLSKILNSSQWCPACHGTREEAVVRHYLEHALAVKFDMVRSRPEWLVDESGRRLELDGLSTHGGVAFEYQGEHHYRRVGYMKGGVGPEEVQRRDRLKEEITKSRGIQLIAVPTLPRNWTDAQARDGVHAALSALSPARSGEFRCRLDGAPMFVRKEASKLAAHTAAVAALGGVLLETSYLGFHRGHLTWCGVEGHPAWPLSPASLARGCWCPQCGRDLTAQARRDQCLERIRRATTLIAEGATDAELAMTLGLAVSTAALYRRRIEAGEE